MARNKNSFSPCKRLSLELTGASTHCSMCSNERKSMVDPTFSPIATRAIPITATLCRQVVLQGSHDAGAINIHLLMEGGRSQETHSHTHTQTHHVVTLILLFIVLSTLLHQLLDLQHVACRKGDRMEIENTVQQWKWKCATNQCRHTRRHRLCTRKTCESWESEPEWPP